jgi:hypothetical protein
VSGDEKIALSDTSAATRETLSLLGNNDTASIVKLGDSSALGASPKKTRVTPLIAYARNVKIRLFN